MARLRAALALALVAGWLVVTTAAASGQTTGETTSVGVYPTSIEVSDGLRGGEYFRSVGMINGSNEDRNFKLEVDGDPDGWLTFVDREDRTTELGTVPVAANSEDTVLVRVRIPKTTPNGDYGGRIRVAAILENPELADGETGAAINLGAEMAVSVGVVGTQRIEGALLEATTVPAIEPGYPLRVVSEFRNTGNVEIVPAIKVVIARVDDGDVVDDTTHDGDVVPPGEMRDITTIWDTTDARTGEYTADVSATFKGVDLGRERIEFKVVPRGTLTRDGTLDDLELVNTPEPGQAAKIRATFTNTGEIEARASFVGELLLDGELIEAVKSVEVLVLRGESRDIEIFAAVPEAGRYTLRGKVNFEGKETATRELSFSVGEGGVALLSTIGIGAGMAGAAGLGIWLIRSMRRRAATRVVIRPVAER